ncbi:hypothetical protein X975_01849, partial [Stegodyphus mimosarum]
MLRFTVFSTKDCCFIKNNSTIRKFIQKTMCEKKELIRRTWKQYGDAQGTTPHVFHDLTICSPFSQNKPGQYTMEEWTHGKLELGIHYFCVRIAVFTLLSLQCLES